MVFSIFFFLQNLGNNLKIKKQLIDKKIKSKKKYFSAFYNFSFQVLSNE